MSGTTSKPAPSTERATYGLSAWRSASASARRCGWAGVVLVVGLLAMASLASSAQAAAVPLGTAANFAVLAGSTVTNTGPSVISGGSLGVSPGSAVTGFGPGTVIPPSTIYRGGNVASKAQNDLTTAYNNVAGRSSIETIFADLAGRTLEPGVYTASTSLALNGDLTLDAKGDPNAMFVFQAGSTLLVGTTTVSSVRLINGAQASNVFWQVGSSATIGVGSAFAGNILALTSIAMQTNATLNGRALARNGAVTLDNNTITAPAPTSDSCEVESDLPAPPLGMTVTQDVVVDTETCTATPGPVQVIPSDEVPADPPDPGRVTRPLPDAIATDAPSASAASRAAAKSCRRWNTHSRVYDNNVANILINELTTTTRWCYLRGIITSGSSPADFSYHEEKRFGFCLPTGCGWKPHKAFNRRVAGCARGCTSVEVHAHVDFSYRGLFDPIGRLFYNHLNSYPKVTGNGGASCRLVFSYRRKPPNAGRLRFFTWKHGCGLA